MKHLLKLTSTHSPCSFVIAIAYECSRTAGGAIKISSRFPRLNWFATTSHWLDRVAWFSAEFTQLPWERNGERSLCVMSICSTVISYFFFAEASQTSSPNDVCWGLCCVWFRQRFNLVPSAQASDLSTALYNPKHFHCVFPSFHLSGTELVSHYNDKTNAIQGI